MDPIRQERRPPVPVLGRLKRCGGGYHSPCRSNSLQRTRRIRSEQDDALLVPGPASRIGRVGEYQRRTAADLDAFELPIGEKAERLAVGRPERRAARRCALCARQRARPEPIQRTKPNGIYVSASVCDERNLPSVWRHNGRALDQVPRCVRDVDWRRNDKADRPRVTRHLAEMQNGQRYG